MKFDFSDDDQSPTFEDAKEQPQHAAVVAPVRWSLKDGAGLVDREDRLLHRESPFPSALLDVRRVGKIIRHREQWLGKGKRFPQRTTAAGAPSMFELKPGRDP